MMVQLTWTPEHHQPVEEAMFLRLELSRSQTVLHVNTNGFSNRILKSDIAARCGTATTVTSAYNRVLCLPRLSSCSFQWNPGLQGSLISLQEGRQFAGPGREAEGRKRRRSAALFLFFCSLNHTRCRRKQKAESRKQKAESRQQTAESWPCPRDLLHELSELPR